MSWEEQVEGPIKEDESKLNIQEDVQKKRKVGVVFAGAPLIPYADDGNLYKPRINEDARDRVWVHNLEHKKRREIPAGFVSFMTSGGGDPEVIEMNNYSGIYKLGLRFFVSYLWDYVYLGLFLLWLILVLLDYDPEITGGEINPNGVVVHLPLLFMMLFYIIPIIGTVYFTIFANDLTRQYAKLTFPYWCFASVIIAQFLEFFLFGGKNRKGLSVRNKEGGGCFGFCAKDATIHLSDSDKEALAMVNLGSIDDDEGQQWADGDGAAEAGPTVGFDSSLESGSLLKIEGGGSRIGTAESKEEPEEHENALFVRLREEANAKALAERMAEAERIRREERKVKDWAEWKCVVCKRKNRRPRYPAPAFQVGFDTKGEFYKRVFAIITPDKKMPRCTKCFSYMDYQPPMGSAQMFKHYGRQYNAFENYPKTVRIQSALLPTPLDQTYNEVMSFFFGRRNNMSSKLLYNDWRLRLWAASKVPENPRPIKPIDELFEVGEVIECTLQKSEWSRARIFVAHDTRCYDIRYDSGEEIRFVEEKNLRLPGEKKGYAYVVELTMVFYMLLQPIVLFGVFVAEAPGAIGVAMMLIGLWLLIVRILTFSLHFYKNYSAGCCMLFKMHLPFMLPLFMMVVSGIGFFSGPITGYFYAACVFVFTKFLCVPILYIMRPTFGAQACALFVQTGAFSILIAMWMDGTPVHPMLAVHMIPGLTAAITMLIYRSWLPFIWDAHLKIRPLYGYDPNDNMLTRIKELIFGKPPVEEYEEEEEEEEFFDPYADLKGDLEEGTIMGEDAFEDGGSVHSKGSKASKGGKSKASLDGGSLVEGSVSLAESRGDDGSMVSGKSAKSSVVS